MKRHTISALFCGSVLVAVSGPVLAEATLVGGQLTITHAFQLEEYQIQVGPIPGRVVVLKSPGVVDGTIFDSVQSVFFVTGNGVDKVEIKAELANDFAVAIETGNGGDEMKVDMKALAGAAVNAGVEVIGMSGENKLEWKVDSDARDLALDLVFNTLAGVDTVVLKVESDTPSDRLAVNILASTGTSDDKIETAIKSAAAVVELAATAATSVGSDTFKLELDQLTPASVTADFAVDLSASSDNGEIALKGSSSTFVVNGLMQGGAQDDSLTLFVEGSATGAPVLDGEFGSDSCSTSLGTVVNCNP